HFSSSRPTVDGPRLVSPRPWRVPRTSRLYVGQSFASSCAGATAGVQAAPRTTASATPGQQFVNAFAAMTLLGGSGKSARAGNGPGDSAWRGGRPVARYSLRRRDSWRPGLP